MFEEPDAAVVQKLAARSVDPETGAFLDSEDSADMKGDKVRANASLCKKIVDDYREFLGQAIKAYEPQMIRINAQADPDQIYLNFMDALQSAV